MIPRGHDNDSARPTKLKELVNALYGDLIGAGVVDAIRHRIAQHLASGAGNSPARALSERDAWLITYADQVQEPGVAPLRTLADSCAQHLGEILSGVHRLHFHPWSSDDGFSVKDYCAVAREYGTWDDIAFLWKNIGLPCTSVSAS